MNLTSSTFTSESLRETNTEEKLSLTSVLTFRTPSRKPRHSIRELNHFRLDLQNCFEDAPSQHSRTPLQELGAPSHRHTISYALISPSSVTINVVMPASDRTMEAPNNAFASIQATASTAAACRQPQELSPSDLINLVGMPGHLIRASEPMTVPLRDETKHPSAGVPTSFRKRGEASSGRR